MGRTCVAAGEGLVGVRVSAVLRDVGGSECVEVGCGWAWMRVQAWNLSRGKVVWGCGQEFLSLCQAMVACASGACGAEACVAGSLLCLAKEFVPQNAASKLYLPDSQGRAVNQCWELVLRRPVCLTMSVSMNFEPHCAAVLQVPLLAASSSSCFYETADLCRWHPASRERFRLQRKLSFSIDPLIRTSQPGFDRLKHAVARTSYVFRAILAIKAAIQCALLEVENEVNLQPSPDTANMPSARAECM